MDRKIKEKIEVVNPQTGKKYLVTIGECEGQAYKIDFSKMQYEPLVKKQGTVLGAVRKGGYYKGED